MNGNCFGHLSEQPGTWEFGNLVQGYRSQENNPPHQNPTVEDAWAPMVVLGRGAVTCERGNPEVRLCDPQLRVKTVIRAKTARIVGDGER